MHQVRGNAVARNEILDKSFIVASIARIEHVAAFCFARKGASRSNLNHVPTARTQCFRKRRANSAIVEIEQPALFACLRDIKSRSPSRSGPPPGGYIEPFPNVLNLSARRQGRSFRQLGTLCAEAAAFEGIGGKSHAPVGVASLELLPVDFDTGGPQTDENGEHRLRIGDLIVRMRQRREQDAGMTLGKKTPDQ